MASRTRGGVRTLAAATAASNTGNWAASVALALVVFAKTGSTVWLSASFLFTQVPSALVAPLSGMMADRLDRKRIMITVTCSARLSTPAWRSPAGHCR